MVRGDRKHCECMSTTCQAKHIDREPGEVVPCMAQILKRRWDAATSITIAELVCWCGAFKVVRQRPAFAQLQFNAGQTNTIYIVKPELQWCTCGIWQDVLYLCWHGCAVVFRKWKE